MDKDLKNGQGNNSSHLCGPIPFTLHLKRITDNSVLLQAPRFLSSSSELNIFHLKTICILSVAEVSMEITKGEYFP